MFRRRVPKPKTLWPRTGLFVFGVLITYYGIALLDRGVFVSRNLYRAEMYSPAVSITGVAFMVLALIPDSLVELLIKRLKTGTRGSRSFFER